MFDDYNDVKQLECGGNDDTGVAGQYSFRMIANKGRPALIFARMSLWVFWHIFSYGTRCYANTQLEQQFIGNAILAPGRITQGQLTDQTPKLYGYRRALRP